MNKTIIITALGLAITASAVTWYFAIQDLTKESATTSVVSKEEVAEESVGTDKIKGRASIMSLFKLGKSMECTFYFSEDDMKGEGTGYFNDNKSRIDSLYSGQGQENVASYMIADGSTNTMYTWALAGGEMRGVKMSLPEETEEIEEGENTTYEQASDSQVDPGTDVNYECKPWMADNSVFIAPADVDFVDMTEMQKMMRGVDPSLGNITVPVQ